MVFRRILALYALALCSVFIITQQGRCQEQGADEAVDIAAVPDLIADLRRAKDLCEAMALDAKSDTTGRRNLAEGARLYSAARAEYNAVITFVSTAVGLSENIGLPKAMQGKLDAAQIRAREFSDWYVAPFVPRGQQKDGHFAAAGPAAILAFVPLALDVAKFFHGLWKEAKDKEAALAAQRRATIREEIIQCTWDRWDRIGSSIGPRQPAQQQATQGNVMYYWPCR